MGWGDLTPGKLEGSVRLREVRPKKSLWGPGEGTPGGLERVRRLRPPRSHLAFLSPPQSGRERQPRGGIGGFREAVTPESGLHLTLRTLEDRPSLGIEPLRT